METFKTTLLKMNCVYWHQMLISSLKYLIRILRAEQNSSKQWLNTEAGVAGAAV